jgi:RNA polymerase sigma factor (sigma-70 family)
MYTLRDNNRFPMPLATAISPNQQRLRQFLDEETADLSRVLRLYAWRAGLPVDGNSIAELLNDVIVEALDHAGRYDPQRPPRAWLLGIGANIVRRRSATRTRQNYREPLAADLISGEGDLGEDEIFERLESSTRGDEGESGAQSGEQSDVLLRDQIRHAREQLSADDQAVIRHFLEGEMSGKALATALETTPGAARVRLHRALNRLRALLSAGQEDIP